jgi:hypothetical protein
MIEKAKIKVIKKKDLKVIKKVEKSDKKKKQEAAREMVANVSTWVNDFQKRKRVETQMAIEQLFPKHPHTNNV